MVRGKWPGCSSLTVTVPGNKVTSWLQDRGEGFSAPAGVGVCPDIPIFPTQSRHCMALEICRAVRSVFRMTVLLIHEEASACSAVLKVCVCPCGSVSVCTFACLSECVHIYVCEGCVVLSASVHVFVCASLRVLRVDSCQGRPCRNDMSHCITPQPTQALVLWSFDGCRFSRNPAAVGCSLLVFQFCHEVLAFLSRLRCATNCAPSP